MEELENIRTIIDEIDDQMAELFNERMKAVENVGKIKKDNGLPVNDPEREKQVIAAHIDLVDERFHEAYQRFMEQLFTISKEQED